MANVPLIKFNGGEYSPLIDARSDIDKYQAGCRVLENMISRIYGPATRRPGTKYIDTCNGVARVMPFIYSNTIAYILLLEDLHMYFYYDGGQVLDTSGRRLSIATPYLEADLFELQYKQSNDVMWIVHNAYAPRKLTRTSANAFSLDSITFTKGPFMKRNDLANNDGVTMAPSVTTGTGILTASSAVFDVGHIGALFAVTQPRVNTSISGTLQATGVLGGSSILTEGPCTLNITDGWSGTIELQRSIDNGVTWEVRRSFYSNDGKRAVQYTFNEDEDNVLHRVYVSEFNSTYNVQMSSFDEDGYSGEVTVAKTSKISGDLTVDSSTQTGRCRVTSYLSTTQLAITVLKDFASTNADTRWYEGAWSTYRGYPKCVTFFKERCVYAATTYQSQTLWLSAVDDFENFDTLKNKADDAFSLTLSSDTRNGIQWITGMESLLVGTTGGEWRVYAESGVFSKTNFELREQTQRGSKELQALPCGDVVLFVDFVGRKIRELTFEGGVKYKYISPDLTALAEHITESGIVGMAFQRNPDPILWCFRDDGTLLSMTYEREQNVIGWARHPFFTGAAVESGITGTVENRYYPTLQELTAAEIPDTPSAPVDTALSSPTSITTPSGLQNITGSNHYQLNADIDLSGVVWTPIADFTGVLDGNGYTISNLTISGTSDYQGLFAKVSTNAEIRNLNLSNFNITGEVDIACLVARIWIGNNNIVFKNITLNDCTVEGTTGVGTLVGYADKVYDVTFYNCHTINPTVNINDNAVAEVGGLIGGITSNVTQTASYFINCSSQGGTVTLAGDDAEDVGGFVGVLSVTGGTFLTGPVCGYVYDCYSTTDIAVTGNDELLVGGFAGKMDLWDLISSYSTGDITYTLAESGTVGGPIGGFIAQPEYFRQIVNCYSTTDITIDTTSSGANTYCTGPIGGFFGRIYSYDSQVLRCYSTGAIDLGDIGSTEGIGGFVGLYQNIISSANNVIERCWSQGDITIDSFGTIGSLTKGGVGGFAGQIRHSTAGKTQDLTIQNCYTWSSITYGDDETGLGTGGFVGSYYTTLAMTLTFDNCYDAQTNIVTGSGLSDQIPPGTYTNGFIGYVSATKDLTLTNSFWDVETSDITTDDYAVSHITDWMQTKSNFTDAGWDFDTIWLAYDDTTWDYSSEGLGCNSVAVIPSSTEDEVWLVVTRIINGSTVRYLEQMQPRDWSAGTNDDTDQWFVDSGLDYDGAATTTLTGLDHLEGEEVCILADGAVVANQTVTNGAITLTTAASRVIAGLPFRYKLKPMRMDFTSGGHTTQTQIKRIGEVAISFYKSAMVEYGKTSDIAAGTLFKLNWRTTEDYDSPPDLFTGDKICNPEGGFDKDDDLIITGNAPVNCTIRAILPRVDVTGR